MISWFLGEQYGEEHILPTIGYAASILIGGYTLFINGLKNLSRFKFDMNTLMTIAVIGAALIGEWGEGATVVILFAISEALERYSMDKARQSIESLMDIAPKEALIRRGNEEMIVHVEDIRSWRYYDCKTWSKTCNGWISCKRYIYTKSGCDYW